MCTVWAETMCVTLKDNTWCVLCGLKQCVSPLRATLGVYCVGGLEARVALVISKWNGVIIWQNLKRRAQTI